MSDPNKSILGNWVADKFHGAVFDNSMAVVFGDNQCTVFKSLDPILPASKSYFYGPNFKLAVRSYSTWTVESVCGLD